MNEAAPPLIAVDPVGWLISCGRRPLRRSLEPVRDVIELRDLRKHHGSTSAIDNLEIRIRKRFFPILTTIFEDVGLRPENRPETVARDAVLHELLDRLCTAGFLRMADVRDALARFQLKLPDTSLKDFLNGDALLRLDRRLADSLYGVYHRGEIYLRGIQRFSSLAFGTPVGRWLTLFIAIPFGGAYLTVEFVKHIHHAASKLIRKYIATDNAPAAHASAFDSETMTAIGLLGLFFLLMIHADSFRIAVITLLKYLGRSLRFLFLTVPMYVVATDFFQFLFNNRCTRFLATAFAMPIVLTTPITLAMWWSYQSRETIFTISIAAFVLNVCFCNTRYGRQLRRDAAEWLLDIWRYFSLEVFAAIANWILRLFRDVVRKVERILHVVDEALRVRPGRPVWIKAMLALLWFPLAYVVRFGFYLLLEPQVNPIKHFPVVTVSHKVMFGLIGTVGDALGINYETAGLILTLVPGVFGFLVWEFKENWKLYATNRPATLKPLPIGHHGETIRGLLQPGFHSGTLPKLFNKIQKEESKPVPNSKRLAKWNRDLDHVRHEVANFVDRQGLAYWQGIPELATVTVGEIAVTPTRIQVLLCRNDQCMKLIWENEVGTIAGHIENAAWTDQTSISTRNVMNQSFEGLFALGSVAVDITWNDWVKFWNSV